MQTIKLRERDYKQLIEDYNWLELRDSKGMRLFNRENNFNKNTIAAILGQFNSLEILDNDTLWGKYEDDQTLLIAFAPDIFSLAKEIGLPQNHKVLG